MFKNIKGFTMIEVLVVVAIIGLLAISLFSSMLGQRDKANDAGTISDLDRLKIAFEDYYNDNNCYPPTTWFDEAADCGTNKLSPYLNSIPCNKATGRPYTITTDSTGCAWFQMNASLTNSATKVPTQNSCNFGFTYCVSSSNVLPSATPLPSGSLPNPSPTVYYSYCQTAGNCTALDPTHLVCSPQWSDSNCGGTGCPTQSDCHAQ